MKSHWKFFLGNLDYDKLKKEIDNDNLKINYHYIIDYIR